MNMFKVPYHIRQIIQSYDNQLSITPRRSGKAVVFIGLCISIFSPCMGASLGPPPITPIDEFFVLGQAPPIPDDWLLIVDGAVEHTLTLTLDEIKQYPVTTEMSTLECYYPTGPSLLVSNANWTGIRLNTILDHVNPSPDARSITFYALDGYRRGPLALDDIRQRDDILLAYDINGQSLPLIQGYPLKLVLPGMAGLQHVRWLERITITTSQPVQELMPYPIHARIFQPTHQETIALGTYTIWGMAFAGEGLEITDVEISTDRGESWDPAMLLNDFVSNVWIWWEFNWEIPEVGEYEIFVRTMDIWGNYQREGNLPFSWLGFGVPVTVDYDHDGDGVPDIKDNCVDIINPTQDDVDLDGIGNACDEDCPRLDTLHRVDFKDVAVLAGAWQQNGMDLQGDLNIDGRVDNQDLLILMHYWLTDCQL